MSPKYWLMKAEPDSRVVKGKDVKFSIDDFENVKTTPWEGVRNHEAKNLMKNMKIGDQILFYHSNCKDPGIAGFAEVSKEAYPDYTAWDESHPYYDAKTDQSNPRWYMIDATLKSRTKHFVPLSLIKHIASLSDSKPPNEIGYIGEEGVKAIKAMALVNRGRLSVQPVEERAMNAIRELADKGGWDDLLGSKSKKTTTQGGAKKAPKGGKRGRKAKEEEKEDEEDKPNDDFDKNDGDEIEHEEPVVKKRKAVTQGTEDNIKAPRRSTRQRR